MSKPICTVMVGLPAMGKSTRVTKMNEMDPDLFVYSTDNILERTAEQLGKTYNDVFEDHIKAAQTEADICLDEAIKHRLDIVLDQTNLGVGKRRKIINRMKQAGYDVGCECIIPPEPGHFDDLKVWKLRLQNRPGKTIPDHVISNMAESYVEPTVNEGFDRITYYNMYGDLLAIDYDLVAIDYGEE